MKKALLSKSDADRFATKIERGAENTCWPWCGGTFASGYGQFHANEPRRSLRAHRVMWALAHERDPAELFVLHTCDNPLCVNPNHLFLGTAKENSEDMVRKGRNRTGERHHWHANPASRKKLSASLKGRALCVGAANGRTKLSDKQVRSIRKDSRLLKEIARDYAVTVSCISGIRRLAYRKYVK